MSEASNAIRPREMPNAGARIPINGTHSQVLRSEQGVPIAVSPSCRHHLTLRLTVSGPAVTGLSRQAGVAR
jgi:hypothetical protein